jgi:hypothetical protein
MVMTSKDHLSYNLRNYGQYGGTAPNADMNVIPSWKASLGGT